MKEILIFIFAGGTVFFFLECLSSKWKNSSSITGFAFCFISYLSILF